MFSVIFSQYSSSFPYNSFHCYVDLYMYCIRKHIPIFFLSFSLLWYNITPTAAQPGPYISFSWQATKLPTFLDRLNSLNFHSVGTVIFKNKWMQSELQPMKLENICGENNTWMSLCVERTDILSCNPKVQLVRAKYITCGYAVVVAQSPPTPVGCHRPLSRTDPAAETVLTT